MLMLYSRGDTYTLTYVALILLNDNNKMMWGTLTHTAVELILFNDKNNNYADERSLYFIL